MPLKLPDKEIKKETSEQYAKKTAGQRFINGLWEFTQSAIAISITIALIYCNIRQIPCPDIKMAFLLVATLYLVRTNHSTMGGIGSKQQNEVRK